MRIINEILASDIISWILGFSGGIIVFGFVDKIQTKIERHNVILSIEQEFNNLFSKEYAFSETKNTNLSLRYCLRDEPKWINYDKELNKIDKSQLFLCIRKYKKENIEEYIATAAMHEVLILFRRMEKLYKDNILKYIDLSDLWREIIPFWTSGRYQFFVNYFGEEDIQSINFVILKTLCACKKNRIESTFDFLRKCEINETNVNEFFTQCKKNKRFRIRDKILLYRYQIGIQKKCLQNDE